MLRPLHAFIASILVVVVAFTGCASIGGSEGFATRALAGLGCIAAIGAAGGQVATDPELGVSTVGDAFNAISKVASGPGLTNAMAACQDSFKYLAEDLAGAKAMVEAKVTNPEPAPQRKARLASVIPSKGQINPVVVKIPLK